MKLTETTSLLILILCFGFPCHAARTYVMPISPSAKGFHDNSLTNATETLLLICQILNPQSTNQEVRVRGIDSNGFDLPSGSDKHTLATPNTPVFLDEHTETLQQWESLVVKWVSSNGSRPAMPKAIEVRISEDVGWVTGTCSLYYRQSTHYDNSKSAMWNAGESLNSFQMNNGRPF